MSAELLDTIRAVRAQMAQAEGRAQSIAQRLRQDEEQLDELLAGLQVESVDQLDEQLAQAEEDLKAKGREVLQAARDLQTALDAVEKIDEEEQ